MPPTHALARATAPPAPCRCNNRRSQPHRLATQAAGDGQAVPAAAPVPRRAALLTTLTTALTAAATGALSTPGRAAADTTAALTPPPPSSSFLPDLPAAPLPKAYVDLTRRLIKELRSSITAEVAGAEEFEVRRAAEPAKAAVKEWVGTYGRGASSAGGTSSSYITAVDGTASHTAIQAALRTLGSFYGSKGQRAHMDGRTADAVLADLVAAEEGLPPPPPPGKGLKERLFGE